MPPGAEEILATIYGCVDEINRQLPKNGQLQKSPASILIGAGGVLDSLGLITLLVALEDALKKKLGLACFLLDEKILVDPQGPFHTIDGLLQWIIASQNKGG
ncbi:MAG: acyl carrier protein [Magnetococcales bacterium]|nr:acyl carrier protein [Magnetococcales bacterium]